MNPSLPACDEATPATPAAPRRTRRLRVLLLRLLLLTFFTGVAWMIVSRISRLDWGEVWRSLQGYGAAQILGAFALALAGYACTSSYDLLGRRYVGHRLSGARTVAINGVAYAFSLNLGALAGGWAFRLRLYTRYGLPVGKVVRIILFAVLTNWSGFVLLAGVVLLWVPPSLPELQALPASALRAVGLLLMTTALAYPLLCARARRRGWTLRLRGQSMTAPEPGLAVLQLALSSASWLLMAMALQHLLPAGISLPETMVALFLSSVLGAAMHVPGNVGVLEGSFTALTTGAVEPAAALAAVIAFRAVYFLAPFAIAALVYAGMEWRAPSRAARVDAGE
jgi:glycosyltransferase 2 family protein